MDIRIEKTKQSIINAFIEIRSRKEVERITVKELCEKARINKSTFYAHYKDIYDLSDQLETELVDSIMENFNHPENLLQNPADFTKEIFRQAVEQGHTEYGEDRITVDPVTTAEYGVSKAARPFNSRLDKKKLVENGFTPLPTWQDALGRYLKELNIGEL